MNDIEALELVVFMMAAMIIPFIPFHREITRDLLPKVPFLNNLYLRAVRSSRPHGAELEALARSLLQLTANALLALVDRVSPALRNLHAMARRQTAGPGTGAEKKPPAGSPPSGWTALLSPVHPLNRFRQLAGREPARLQPGPERRPLSPVPAVPRLSASPSPPADAQHADPVPDVLQPEPAGDPPWLRQA